MPYDKNNDRPDFIQDPGEIPSYIIKGTYIFPPDGYDSGIVNRFPQLGIVGSDGQAVSSSSSSSSPVDTSSSSSSSSSPVDLSSSSSSSSAQVVDSSSSSSSAGLVDSSSSSSSYNPPTSGADDEGFLARAPGGGAVEVPSGSNQSTVDAALATGNDVLFERGGTYTNITLGDLGGGNKLIGTYGTGGRPLFKTGGTNFISTSFSDTRDNVQIVGLRIYANTRDPNSADYVSGSTTETGIRWFSQSDNLLIEDCEISYFKDAIVLQANNSSYNITNSRINRNIIMFQYAPEDSIGHSQGMYITRTTGTIVTENAFTHNGHNDLVAGAERVKFNHNIYCSTANDPIIIQGNYLDRGASHGVQLRPGGAIIDNLITECAYGCFAIQTNSVVERNVVMYGDDITTETNPGGGGIESFSINTLTLNDNTVIKRQSVGTKRGIDVSPANISYDGNVVYQWSNSTGEGIRISGANVLSAGTNYTFENPSQVVDSTDEVSPAEHNYMVTRGIGEWAVANSPKEIAARIRASFQPA